MCELLQFEPIEIELQFGDAGLDIVESPMDFLFLKLDVELALHQYFPGADVQHAVMQLEIERRPPLLDEQPVVMNRVAGQNGWLIAKLFLDEFD